MFRVIDTAAGIADAQRQLMRTLKSQLKSRGPHKISFRPNTVTHPLFANADGGLYYAYSPPHDGVAIRRHWNSFGMFHEDATAQEIIVEINVPEKGKDGRVSGFFATDDLTGAMYLFHDGGVGGGRKGISRSALLDYVDMPTVTVSAAGEMRNALLIGNVADPNLTALIWRYVQTVSEFKTAAVKETSRGKPPELEVKPEDEVNYSAEYWGPKSGLRKAFDYIAYHGLVVDELRRDLEQSLSPECRLGNSRLIDLYVQNGSKRTEIFEVKTSADRQSLYTAIGQLLAHGGGNVSKLHLVIPSGPLPSDMDHALARLGIATRRFKIIGAGADARVTLLPRE